MKTRRIIDLTERTKEKATRYSADAERTRKREKRSHVDAGLPGSEDFGEAPDPKRRSRGGSSRLPGVDELFLSPLLGATTLGGFTRARLPARMSLEEVAVALSHQVAGLQAANGSLCDCAKKDRRELTCLQQEVECLREQAHKSSGVILALRALLENADALQSAYRKLQEKAFVGDCEMKTLREENARLRTALGQERGRSDRLQLSAHASLQEQRDILCLLASLIQVMSPQTSPTERTTDLTRDGDEETPPFSPSCFFSVD